jgi:hypothetical protein
MQQDDSDDRAGILKRDGFLIGIAGVSRLNGMHFSPLFDPAFLLLRAFAPGLAISSPLLMFYFTSLLLSAATLIVAGVPAALFERFTGRRESDTTSLGIWLAVAGVMAIPSLLGSGGI